MNEILSKIKKICTLDVNITSSSTPVSVQKLNIDFQTKLQDSLLNIDNEYTAAITYLKYMNTHIMNIIPNINVTFLDKIQLLQAWYNNIKNKDDDTNNADIAKVEIGINQESTFKISDLELTVSYNIPSIKRENEFLDYILQLPSHSAIDIVFFDNFRFIQNIKFSDGAECDFNTSTIGEIHQIFLLFDTPILKNITSSIEETLSSISSLRQLEGDFSFYTSM